MVDREKVIKGLQHCVEKLDTIVNKRHGFNCVECPYYRKCENIGSLVGLPLMRDALALLKAQEKQSKHKYKNENHEDWSGAQGNDIERIKEQAARSEWGIYG